MRDCDAPHMANRAQVNNDPLMTWVDQYSLFQDGDCGSVLMEVYGVATNQLKFIPMEHVLR